MSSARTPLIFLAGMLSCLVLIAAGGYWLARFTEYAPALVWNHPFYLDKGFAKRCQIIVVRAPSEDSSSLILIGDDRDNKGGSGGILRNAWGDIHARWGWNEKGDPDKFPAVVDECENAIAPNEIVGLHKLWLYLTVSDPH